MFFLVCVTKLSVSGFFVLFLTHKCLLADFVPQLWQFLASKSPSTPFLSNLLDIPERKVGSFSIGLLTKYGIQKHKTEGSTRGTDCEADQKDE